MLQGLAPISNTVRCITIRNFDCSRVQGFSFISYTVRCITVKNYKCGRVRVLRVVVFLCLQDCIMDALKDKTVILVTHQVEFLHAVNLILVSYSLSPSS